MTDVGSMSIDEALAHFGVKGMKWGVRNSRPSGSEIVKARNRLAKEKSSIRAQKKAVRKASRPETKEKRKAELEKMKIAHLNNPDRATALRINKGQIALNGIMLSIAPTPVTAAAIGSNLTTQYVTRKVVERKQKTGAYNR